MNNNQKQPRRTCQLEKKLAAYSLAGAAALIAPAAAKASIVYESVDMVVNSPNSYGFFLTGSALPDISINADDGEIDASTNNSAEVFMDTVNSDVAALGFGAIIDPTSSSNWGTGGKMASALPIDSGDWSTGGGTSYLGFEFGNPLDPEAGWAEISTTVIGPATSFEILSYAYETVGDTRITAGEGAPTPEPSALPLLALGGIGLIALRRRRAANA